MKPKVAGHSVRAAQGVRGGTAIRMSAPLRGWMAAALTVVLVLACGPAANEPTTTERSSGELIVFAAASLIDAFDELRETFERHHPAIEVIFNFAGSQTLANQINEGAAADVFASADTTQMDSVADAGNLADAPDILTTNRLTIAVEDGNPQDVSSLEDLTSSNLIVVLPAEQVPAGRYAREAIDAAGIELTPSSYEQDVRAALAKVELGEADASIVYNSDVVTSDRVDGIEIPPGQNITATYPIGVLADAPNPVAAEAFVTFVLSEEGQQILATYGFVMP